MSAEARACANETAFADLAGPSRGQAGNIRHIRKPNPRPCLTPPGTSSQAATDIWDIAESKRRKVTLASLASPAFERVGAAVRAVVVLTALAFVMTIDDPAMPAQ